jgi:hypothetical protein
LDGTLERKTAISATVPARSEIGPNSTALQEILSFPALSQAIIPRTRSTTNTIVSTIRMKSPRRGLPVGPVDGGIKQQWVGRGGGACVMYTAVPVASEVVAYHSPFGSRHRNLPEGSLARISRIEAP